MITKIASILFVLFSICSTASAQVKAKQKVAQGIRNGQITKAEADSIRASHTEIKKVVKQAKSDSTITAAEKKAIKKEQKEAARVIRRSRHNDKNTN